MSIFNGILNFSVPIIVTTNDKQEVYGSGFFLKKKNRLFLFTSYILVSDAKKIKFATKKEKDVYQLIDFPNFKETCWRNQYDIARFEINEAIFKGIKFDYFLTDEKIIHEDLIKEFRLLEDLFVISNPCIKYPVFKDSKYFSAITKCSNATSLDSMDIGFFLVNLKCDNLNWRLGSPVYAGFKDKIYLVGMISGLGMKNMPNDFSAVAPSEAIRGLLEYELPATITVLENKYDTPKKAAETASEVKRNNYLADSIRKIENIILKELGKIYKVIVATSKINKKVRIYFYDNCCEIWLPLEDKEMDDKKNRLILAYELGHIFYNIEKLLNPETLNRLADIEEEKYAWKFAFHLMKIKSNEHEKNTKTKRYVHEEVELKQMLFDIVEAKNPEICDDIIRDLKISLPKKG